MLESSFNNVQQKPSVNNILNTGNNPNSNTQANSAIPKITGTTDKTLNTIATSEDIQTANQTNKFSNSNVLNITNNKLEAITIEAQNKSTAAKIPVTLSHVNKQASQTVCNQTLNQLNNQAIKIESITKSQETIISSIPNQVPLSVNNNVNLNQQKSLSGKFNIVSGNNSATQSSTNINISIPSNTLSSNNLNIIGKNNLQSEGNRKAVASKNEEFVSYDTESNDSSPRVNLQSNVNSNNVGNALNSKKNVNSFSAYIASQGKTVIESNSVVNNANSSSSNQAKNLKVSFPITGVIDETGKLEIIKNFTTNKFFKYK